jgi:hypothetical protein
VYCSVQCLCGVKGLKEIIEVFIVCILAVPAGEVL